MNYKNMTDPRRKSQVTKHKCEVCYSMFPIKHLVHHMFKEGKKLIAMMKCEDCHNTMKNFTGLQPAGEILG